MTYKVGDRVSVTLGGRTVTALVVIASENGHALIVDWTTTDDGMLGDETHGWFAGRMPILLGEDDTYRELIGGRPVILAWEHPP